MHLFQKKIFRASPHWLHSGIRPIYKPTLSKLNFVIENRNFILCLILTRITSYSFLAIEEVIYTLPPALRAK